MLVGLNNEEKQKLELGQAADFNYLIQVTYLLQICFSDEYKLACSTSCVILELRVERA